jgi:hypothetical protein
MFKSLPDHDAPAAYHDREPAGRSLRHSEAAFRDWVDGIARPDVLTVGPRPCAEMPLEQLLASLQSSTALLAPARGRAIGLDDRVSVADAATELLHVRFDPKGPRCRSFRAASYYLAGLARLETEDALVTADAPNFAAVAPRR